MCVLCWVEFVCKGIEEFDLIDLLDDLSWNLKIIVERVEVLFVIEIVNIVEGFIVDWSFYCLLLY